MTKQYELPPLPFGYEALEPIISREQLRLHHDKHHKAYVDKANELVGLLDEARKTGDKADTGSIARKLSFNAGGHVLHSLMWQNLRPPRNDNAPAGDLAQDLESDFGSIERFMSEFLEAATTIEGSGWAVVAYCPHLSRLIIEQIGNHNQFLVPNRMVILSLDMWEHAYYLDYRNDKQTYAKNCRQIINWEKVAKRNTALKGLYEEKAKENKTD